MEFFRDIFGERSRLGSIKDRVNMIGEESIRKVFVVALV